MGYSSKNAAAGGGSPHNATCSTSGLRTPFLLFAGLQVALLAIALSFWRFFVWRDAETAARKEAEESYWNLGRKGFIAVRRCAQCKNTESHEMVDLEAERGDLKDEWVGEAFYKCNGKLYAQKISFSYRHGECQRHTEAETFLRLIHWSPDEISSYPSLVEPREVSHEEAVKRKLAPAMGDCDGNMTPPIKQP